MRKLTAFMAVAGIAASALGQNVIVVMNDGTSHKFNADYISEIRFTDDTSEAGTIVFDNMSYELYTSGSNSNFYPTFTTEGVRLIIDMYAPMSASLATGVYTVGATEGNFVFADYTELYLDGERAKVESGTVTVAEPETGVYSFDIDFMLENGSNFKATYTGKIGGSFSSLLEISLAKAYYNENPQLPGEFYVKMEGNSPKTEMAIDFFANTDATLLPAGKYVYSTANTPGTFSQKSYVDMFGPYSSNRMKEGSEVNVTVDGNAYTFDMTLIFEDGRTAYMTYTGEVTGTPSFEQPVVECMVFDSMSYNYYGSGNFWGQFVSGDKTLELDMYGPQDAPYLLPGTYTVGASQGNYIDTGDWSSYTVNGVMTLLSAGTVTISDNNGIYTFDIDLELANGETLKAKYEGMIGGAYSSLLNYNIQNANYNGNPNPAGEFYIKMSAHNPNIEMALDIFADADATVLPAGKYVYSEDNAPGTFNNYSYVDLWGPYSSNRMKEGSEVNVAVDGNVYTIDMTLIFEDGRTAYINYTGEISGTPTFE